MGVRTKQAGLPRAGARGCHQGVEQSCLEGWEQLDVQKQKAGIGIEANASGPAPAWGSPAPLPGGSCRDGPGRSGPLGQASCPRREGSEQRGARGVPHPAHPHPARAPQSAPGAARAMLAAPATASTRAESRRRRRRRPDPLALPLPGSPAAGQSRPCRPCPTRASRRLSPAPPPTPARLEGKGGGKGGGCPLPIHILCSFPSLLPRTRAGMLGYGVQLPLS